MSSKQSPHRPPARRRMTGYSPPDKVQQVAAAEESQPAVDGGASSVSGSDSARSSPVRKRRMGSGSIPVDTPKHKDAEAGVLVPKKRMGESPTPQQSTAAEDISHAKLAGTARMGSAAAPTTRPGGTGPANTGVTKGGRPAWVKPVIIIAGLLVAASVLVLGARWLRTMEGVQEFIEMYDGHATQPASAPEGMPWWLGWQHFFNMFLIVLIIRTGLQVRTERKPPGYWTPKKGSFFSPNGNTPRKVSLSQWLHQCLDVLWVVNGLVFVVLLVVTDHWMRIVPVDMDIFPNMLSGMIQYASLDWPTENGWVHYNALQVMAYFITVFIAAPLAILSGLRISTWWPEEAERLNQMYPLAWARAVHFPVMLYFVGFTVVHVFLVFFTGALRNLNHMYTSRPVVDWWGLVIFLISLLVIAAAWFLAKPLFITPIADRMGKVSK